MLPEVEIAVAAPVTRDLILMEYAGADYFPVFFAVSRPQAAGAVTFAELLLVPRKSANHDIKFPGIGIESPLMLLGVFPSPFKYF